MQISFGTLAVHFSNTCTKLNHDVMPETDSTLVLTAYLVAIAFIVIVLALFAHLSLWLRRRQEERWSRVDSLI